MKLLKNILFLCFIIMSGIACSTVQSHHSSLGSTYPSRPDTFEVEIFQTGMPAKPFEKISRLDVHLEKTHFIPSTLKDALPELKRQARLSGADAIIDIQERKSMVGETKVYHVSGTGIRYTDSK